MFILASIPHSQIAIKLYLTICLFSTSIPISFVDPNPNQFSRRVRDFLNINEWFIVVC